MAGYNDTKAMIISTLMGRPAGTEIQPENQQAYELNMLDYIRSLELISSSPIIGIADETTTPVQPDNARVSYIAGVAQNRTVTFQNFIGENGQPLSITTGDMEAYLVILLWNAQYWTMQAIPTNIVSSSDAAYFYYSYNIRKTYASVAAMNADSVNPIGIDGKPIKLGDIVSVVNNGNSSENGFYSYEGAENGWKLQSSFNFQLVQTTGTDVNSAMSQKAVTDELALKFDKTAVKQTTGTSETDVMSQKATTEAIHEILYDVSANNAGAVFESLSALLSSPNLSTLIPTSVRHGGMSIRFVQSSDNKYVQARCMAQNFATDVNQWQGNDNEIEFGNKNLIESGTVANAFLDTDYDIGKEKTYIWSDKSYSNMILVAAEGYPKTPTSSEYKGIIIPLVPGVKYVINNQFYSIATFSSYPVKNDDSNVLRINFVNRNVVFTAGENENYLLVSLRLSESSVASITRKSTGLTNKVSAVENSVAQTNNSINNLSTDINVINTKIGTDAKSETLTSEDFCGLRWNGKVFAASSAVNGLYFAVLKGQIISFGNVRQDFYSITNKPVLNGVMNNAIYKSAVLEYTIEQDGYLFFNILNAASFEGLFYTITGIGVKKDIQDLIAADVALNTKINNTKSDIKTEVDALGLKIGVESKTVSFTYEDSYGVWWNGTSVIAATGNMTSFVLEVFKGITYNVGDLSELSRRLNIYHVSELPVIGTSLSIINTYPSVVGDILCTENGYFYCQKNNTNFNPQFVFTGIGVKKDIQDLQNQDITFNNKFSNTDVSFQMQALVCGNRLVKDAKTFSWLPFTKPIISLRCDDLNMDVDLVASIVIDAGLPIIIAAPNNLYTSVSGITDPTKKIGNTKLEVLQYVIAHGGEVLEHSYQTFESADYMTSIKPLFVDSKREFLKNGINIRGAAVANANPSDSLRDALAPYLYYYYEFSNGYGKVAPYSQGVFPTTNDATIKTLAQFQAKVDETISNNGFWTYVIHNLTGDVTEQIFRDMVDYVAQKKELGLIDVMTWGEVFDEYGQFT